MHSKTTSNDSGDYSSKDGGSDSGSGEAIGRFVGVAFVLGALAQVGAVRDGLRHGGQGWLWLTMWAPAVAAFTASHASRRLAWAALRASGWRWLGPGLLLGLAPPVLKVGLLAATGTGTWDTRLELTSDGSAIQAVHQLGLVLGTGAQRFGHFAVNVVLSVLLGSVVSGVLGGIGEEVGWRGFLQPALERRYGRFKGTVLVGLLWAAWHLPVNLMGYNDDQHPALNALVLFPLTVLGMSFTFAWLTRRSGSAWPAAFAHGANNTLAAGLLLTPRTWTAEVASEIASMAVVAAVFVWAAATEARFLGRGP